jgi:hypothetical protein
MQAEACENGPVHRVALLVFTCLAAGCGGGGSEEAREADRGGTTLRVSHALRAQPGRVIQVRGALHVDSGHVRLCTRLDDSYPPECAGPALRVHGLAYDTVAGLQTSPDESMHWADDVVVSGRVEADGSLRVE